MRLDTIWGKSPALFNGGLLLGNIDHIELLRNEKEWNLKKEETLIQEAKENMSAKTKPIT